MKTLLIAAGALALMAGQAEAKTLSVTPGGDAQEKLQTALLDAKPGDTVAIAAGRYELTDGLSLDIAGVTVKGAGPAATILSFKGQKSSGEGFLVTSNKVTIRDLGVEDSKGDGIKSKGVDQISFVNLRVEWTGGPKETNGAYGVYPVASTNVLIDRVTVKGASDAGIYVGQSKNIIVKNSRAEFNVAGIEIENSMNADVFDNVSTHNAGGILVFDLPNLPQMGGHSTRIFRNKVVQNDTKNFAKKGAIVGDVPTGTGVMLMANRNVHVFENEIDQNQTAAVMLVSYTQKYDDLTYNPLPRDIVVRDNKIGKNGWAPQFPGGDVIAKALGGALPPVVWDGVSNYTRKGATAPEVVHVRLLDGPVANLHFSAPGNVFSAKPEMTPKIDDGAVAEPKPVVLPKAQAAL
ncbi:parallel beta-helix domain-containing protein [Phenylobacterium sp.]|uniref:parallel beta-helix domain-containing protein n=1 Tax=Phenylobacterium sp. TaxID=1871053 RepID=UPI0035678BC0